MKEALSLRWCRVGTVLLQCNATLWCTTAGSSLEHCSVSLDITSDLYNPMTSTVETICLAKVKTASLWRHILTPSLVALSKHQSKPPSAWEVKMSKMEVSYSGMMTGNYFKSGTRIKIDWKSPIYFSVRSS